MTKEEFEALIAKVEAETGKSIDTKVQEALKEMNPETLAKAVEEMGALKTALETAKTENERIEGIVKTQGIAITKLKENGGGMPTGFKQEVDKFIEDNLEKIQSIKSAGSGMVELVSKVVGNITTGTGVNTSPPNITGTQQAPLSNVNLRGADLLSLTSNVSTSLPAYPYTEAKPKDGDYAFVAEGTVKPQTDFTWETNYAKPVKIAAWLRLTDESIQDVVGLQSVANDFLRKKHALKKQNGILFGDGNAPNPKGATLFGRAFVAGAMATAVKNPNIMDVINAAVTDIYSTHNYDDETSYMPSLCVVNPVDFYLQFVSVKNADGNPLYPTASLFNIVNIGGLTIIPERSIPAGKIFIADMSKYNTTDYLGYTVKIGYVNDDFIKNQFVILGESRFHAFVKKLDEQAFIYDDIATIKTAITAP